MRKLGGVVKVITWKLISNSIPSVWEEGGGLRHTSLLRVLMDRVVESCTGLLRIRWNTPKPVRYSTERRKVVQDQAYPCKPLKRVIWFETRRQRNWWWLKKNWHYLGNVNPHSLGEARAEFFRLRRQNTSQHCPILPNTFILLDKASRFIT